MHLERKCPSCPFNNKWYLKKEKKIRCGLLSNVFHCCPHQYTLNYAIYVLNFSSEIALKRLRELLYHCYENRNFKVIRVITFSGNIIDINLFTTYVREDLLFRCLASNKIFITQFFTFLVIKLKCHSIRFQKCTHDLTV